ncbi:DNA excision repair protein ERCC-6-like [Carassius gibelio]|uniref:DNA excision repair protein ERCC-6-like n=1 Tax=Carassius gibelio TaxID=101364 RepID=UPI002277E9BD|nr:DNA excision repair protein ERCC-6-like [Carassius gibelio]
MPSNKVEEITDKLESCLSIDTKKMDKYNRYQQEGKEAVKRDDLPHALKLFQLAYQLQPSDKLKKRIQAIEDRIQRDVEEDEEEDEFVDVNDSGLKLYKVLYNQLYDYQKEGVAFLYSLHRDGRKGGILADDMGLGKTIQVISFLSGMYDAELANHTLLVMPTSLIQNWVREFKKWSPGIRVKVFHGTNKAERNRNLEQIQRRGGVIITTYQMLINNYEQLASYDQCKFEWDYVILDEAHKIKTPSTKTAKSVRAIPAQHRVLLTGTPVQNNLQEMWALYEFACQGSLLGTYKTFKTEYENPITRAREKDATPEEKALGLKISQNLIDIIKPYFLRRTKADVQHKKDKREEGYEDEVDQENQCPNAGKGIEMPSLTRKNDLIVWTYLNSIQENIYKQFTSLDHIKELRTTNRSPLSELVELKKICDHPRLLSNRAVTQLGLEQSSASIHPSDLSDETLVAESGKLQFLVSLMECLREEGHRTLIFSQSRKMLDIIAHVLLKRNFQILRLDGTVTKLAEREKRIKLFQTKKRYTIFLLTTQVGGVGVTLTAANRVVIFDPSWNPATDAQAVDRAYRIGQSKNVIIYRLITCGTVEEKIYRRQVFKESLIRQSTGDKKNPFRYFSKQELHELFNLEDTRSSTTQQQLQAMHAHHRRSDTSLDQHIARLQTMEMCGISDHDLMFTKEVAANEDDPEDEESHKYIQTRVQKAQELMQVESELHCQFKDNVAQNIEPAQTGQLKSARRDFPAPPCIKNKLVTVDVTYDFFDEPEIEEDEQNFPKVEDAEMENVSEEEQIVDKEDQVKTESPWSGGERNVQVSPAADKLADTVITLDDSLDEEDVLYDNGASEKRKSVHDMPSTSCHFPKLEELSIASDAVDNQEVQVDKPNSMIFSSPQSPHDATAGESFKADVEMLQGNLQLEDSANMFSVEEEEGCDVDESLAEESPEFQLQMDVSGERLEEASIHESSRHYGKPNNGEISKCNDSEIFNPSICEVSKHESLLTIRSTPDTPSEDSFVHSVRNRKRQIISDTDEEEEDSEKPCITGSPLADGLNRLGCLTPKSTLTDSSRLWHSLNTSVASRRSFIVSMLENDSDEESEEPSENKTKSYETSEASKTHADDSVVEDDEQSGGKTKSYEASEASESHADDSVVEDDEQSGGKTKSYEASEASESHADDYMMEDEEPSGGKTKSYEASEASETHADNPVVEEEEPSVGKTKSFEASEASETHADDSVMEEEEDSGGKTKSYEASEASETHADDSVVEEEEPSVGKNKSFEASEASETHADDSVVEDDEQSGGKTKSYETSEASETHADDSVVEDEEPSGGKTKYYETSEASETHADDSVMEEEENSGGKTKSYEASEASETHADDSVMEEEEDSGGKTKSYEASEASETHADDSMMEEEEDSGGKTKSFEASEASETHADDSMVEDEEQSGGKSKYYETSEASETHADESAMGEEEPNGDKTKSIQISEARESQTDELVVEEEEPSQETLNSEESEVHEELEEIEESVDSGRYQEEEEWHSALFESTVEFEQDSNEMIDQCAPKTFPPLTHILPVSSTSSDVTTSKPSENTYEMLVLSGKQCLAEGRKQEALDFFLKAIDINIGDAEIQLLIIHLYRQLRQ